MDKRLYTKILKLIKRDVKAPATFYELFNENKVIIADEAAKHLYFDNSKENWSFDRDFTNLTPVDKTFFIDIKAPVRTRSEFHGQWKTEDLKRTERRICDRAYEWKGR